MVMFYYHSTSCSMLVMKKFASPIEMQNSVILLEAIQPRELDSYWKVHAYSKILTICIMSLAESKNPNTLAELADKVCPNWGADVHVYS